MSFRRDIWRRIAQKAVDNYPCLLTNCNDALHHYATSWFHVVVNELPSRSRIWSLRLWIIAVSFLFPICCSLYALAIAEGIFGDMEPVFAICGAFLVGTLIALVCGSTLMATTMNRSLYSGLRPVLIIVTCIEFATIPICYVIVAYGRHLRSHYSQRYSNDTVENSAAVSSLKHLPD